MPLIVPRVDETSGGAVPLSAPEIAPMRNYRDQQAAQLAAETQKAGSLAFQTGQSMGLKIQETIDDANVRKAETQFLQQGTAITTDYTHQLGEDAYKGYDAATQNLVKAKDDANSLLTNDIQRRMFGYVAQQHLTSFGKTLADHNFDQTTTWRAKEGTARVDSVSLQAANNLDSRNQVDADGKPTGMFNTFATQMEREALGVAAISGKGPDSAQAKELVRTAWTNLNVSVISRLLDNHDSAGAQAWFEQQVAQGHMNLDAQRQWGSAIKTNVDRDHIVNGTEDLIRQVMHDKQTGALPGASDSGYQEWLKTNKLTPSDDYDMYAAYKAGVKPENGHMSDEYKLPTHPTYSDESIYAKKPGAPEAGTWTQQGEKWTFTATKTNVQNAGGVAGMKAYFDQVEPGNTVVLPNGERYTGTATPGEKSWEEFRAAGKPSTPVVTYISPNQGGNITSDMTDTRDGGTRPHYGIDIALPVGSKVAATANGTVKRIWNDPKGGLMMEIQHPDGYLTDFAHLSATNVPVGSPVQQGDQVATTGNSGDATNAGSATRGVLHWAMKDPNGNWVDPRQQGAAPPKLDQFTDTSDLKAVLDAIDASNESPYMKREMRTYAEGQQRRYRAIADEAYQQVHQSATDDWYQHNGDWTKMNATLFGQLKPQDQFAFKKGIPTETDPQTMTNLILDPKQVTVDNVKTQFAAGKLSKGDYYQFLEKAVAMQKQPDKVIEASVDANRVKYLADAAGLPDMYAPKTEEENKDYAKLFFTIQTRVDKLQQQTGGKATMEQKDAITKQELAQFKLTHLRGKFAKMLGFQPYQNLSPYVFQFPAGATQIVPGSNGTFAYADASGKILGTVPEVDSEATDRTNTVTGPEVMP